MRKNVLKGGELLYKHLIRKILFLRDPETIHEHLTNFGEILGKARPAINTLNTLMEIKDPMLEQTLSNIKFQNPIGLAAGFDYDARLTQVAGSLGFGYETVGTITNLPYKGNSKPMFGRLPKSKSLMVNKGFKNSGAKKLIKKLKDYHFEIPIGVSIGRSNSKSCNTRKKCIADIIQTFRLFEHSNIGFSYYELNISCPNLYDSLTFYPPEKLRQLLSEIDKLDLKKPVFVKMPLEESNNEVLKMLNVIANYSPKGVIFSNLSKNRKNMFLNSEEINKFPAGIGSFSGKPTEKRSNELIKLASKSFGKKLVIIGCGGVFNAKDAYTKIKLGASLVQLVTGLIYEGPLLAAQINLDLKELLKKDGFTHISQAIGSNTR